MPLKVLKQLTENTFTTLGTDQFLMDTRRGLYSYEALRSRLAQNRFLGEGLKDFTGPVLHLANLSPEELFVLLRNLRHVVASGDPAQYLLPDEALVAFMEHCARRLGEAYFRTPRSTIRAFLELLAVLEQNPQASWRDLLGSIEVQPDTNPDLEPLTAPPAPASAAPRSDGDELATFKL